MSELFRYIAAVRGADGTLSIVDEEKTDLSYTEQGMRVTRIETLFAFSDGVQLKQRIEIDELPDAADVCEECWISYEVITAPSGDVTPAIKTFTNRCQESFWLKAQTIRAS